MSAIQKSHTFDFKTQYGLGFDPQDDEIIVDFFCGGGGAGTGLEMGLGRKVSVAKNHSAKAISMHSINHPGAKHFTTDVFDGDPDTECGGKAVGWFHMSPDCTHHSQAAGGQPRKREIRNLSWIGLKWAGKKKPRVISLENVKQILQWGPLIAKRDKTTGRIIKLVPGVNKKGKQVLVKVVAAPGEIVPVGEQFLVPDPKRKGSTWKRFVELLEQHGYVVEWRVIKACDFGAPTSRERLFMIARCDGLPIVWPEPTHAKKPGKGQQKYRTAAECIDFSDLGKSIFGRKDELADATKRRIAKGMRKFVIDHPAPFIVPIANWSTETVQSLNEPLRTVTSHPKGGAFSVVSPIIAPATHQGSDRINDPLQPLPTVTCANRGELTLISPTLIQTGYWGTRRPATARAGIGSTVGDRRRWRRKARTRCGAPGEVQIQRRGQIAGRTAADHHQRRQLPASCWRRARHGHRHCLHGPDERRLQHHRSEKPRGPGNHRHEYRQPATAGDGNAGHQHDRPRPVRYRRTGTDANDRATPDARHGASPAPTRQLRRTGRHRTTPHGQRRRDTPRTRHCFHGASVWRQCWPAPG